MNQKSISIIGGGIGGLATAILMAKDGHKVSVYEKNECLGGRASIFSANGYTFDMGPSRYLMPDLFERFFAEIGEDINDHLDLAQLSPSYKVFYPGEVEEGSKKQQEVEEGKGEQETTIHIPSGSLPEGFVRAIIKDTSGRILSQHTKKRNLLVLPGGSIENGENPETALARELQEELGITDPTMSFIGSQVGFFGGGWKRGYFYEVVVDTDTITNKEPEKIEKFVWVEVNSSDRSSLVVHADGYDFSDLAKILWWGGYPYSRYQLGLREQDPHSPLYLPNIYTESFVADAHYLLYRDTRDNSRHFINRIQRESVNDTHYQRLQRIDDSGCLKKEQKIQV